VAFRARELDHPRLRRRRLSGGRCRIGDGPLLRFPVCCPCLASGPACRRTFRSARFRNLHDRPAVGTLPLFARSSCGRSHGQAAVRAGELDLVAGRLACCGVASPWRGRRGALGAGVLLHVGGTGWDVHDAATLRTHALLARRVIRRAHQTLATGAVEFDGHLDPYSANRRPGPPGKAAKDRRINNCRDFKVAITLRVMIANKNWTVIDSPIPGPVLRPLGQTRSLVSRILGIAK